MSLTRKSGDMRSLLGILLTGLSGALVLVALLPLLAVLSYVLIKGFSRLNGDLLTQLPPPPMVPGGGIANAIVGTLIMVGLAACISVPIGLFSAIYLAEFSPPGAAKWIRFATNVLNGVPSIILGVFAYAALVVTTKTFSALAGAIALAILMLPIIIRTTDEALQIVPQDIRWASVGVGASNYQTVLQIVVPAALPAIITGTTLAIARAAGETAPLIFTALFTQFWPNSLLQPTPSLSVLVYNFATVPFKNQQELAWAASLILVLLVLTTSIVSRLALRQKTY
ncbi:MAG: phosphate ABC transporter permease PstA [Thermosynechococcaceae cyanobacterium]